MTTEKILQDREKTHGSFAKNAQLSQNLKNFFRTQNGTKNMTDVQKESLDMIALKLSRILSGNHTAKEHWDDIAGYATLVSKYLQNEKSIVEKNK